MGPHQCGRTQITRGSRLCVGTTCPLEWYCTSALMGLMLCGQGEPMSRQTKRLALLINLCSVWSGLNPNASINRCHAWPGDVDSLWTILGKNAPTSGHAVPPIGQMWFPYKHRSAIRNDVMFQYVIDNYLFLTHRPRLDDHVLRVEYACAPSGHHPNPQTEEPNHLPALGHSQPVPSGSGTLTQHPRHQRAEG